jgi:hypothetical protein
MIFYRPHNLRQNLPFSLEGRLFGRSFGRPLSSAHGGIQDLLANRFAGQIVFQDERER